ncbi:MAG: ABC transporter permease [Kiritimatiellales bacterium]|nr:ABC transporter permease [Kiritimatiellales bacterium]
MNHTIGILLKHDLAVAFKNKTLYLVVCIPLFVFATLSLVDPAKAHDARIKIALLQTGTYAPHLLESIEQAPDLFAARRIPDEQEAVRLLGQGEVDGILIPVVGDAPRLQLKVVRQASVETLAILLRLSALQIGTECQNPNWVAEVQPLQTSSIKRQTLPTWILMMVLLVGFIVLPAQVAEEKEKQLLLGWLQTPVRESEWMAAKLAHGIVLMLIAVLVLQLTAGELYCAHAASYFAILCAGGFCFGSLGVCLGLLCRSQASARTLGLLCYLPLLMPAALSDMSQELRRIAPLVPSYHFYEPIRSLLLESAGPESFARAWITLMVIGLIACAASHRLLKKRWLM